VRVVQKSVASEICVVRGVSGCASFQGPWRLTTLGAKTYPSAAAREGSARIPVFSSMLPSRPKAVSCQGRRPFKEFFQ